MSDVVVTHTGFFSRLKNAIFGILIGIIMIPGSVVLMGWNEHRTVHRSRGLSEGLSLVQTVSDPSTIDPSRDQSLIHMTGLADTREILRDDQFHVEKLGIKLSREVQMYQWDEDEKSQSRRKTGGGRSTRKTYSYHKRWKPGRISSESFHNSNGHINPQLRFGEKDLTAKQVNIGAFLFDDQLKSSINAFEDIPWSSEMIERLAPEMRDKVTIEDNFLYWSSHGTQGKSNPTLGDLRIKFKYVPPVDVSFVTRQDEGSFSPFETSNGEKIHSLYVGDFTAEEVFGKLKSENQMWAWVWRALGLALCTAGFSLILGPISVIADVIPFLGTLTRGATFFVSLLLAVCISATTIAFSWIAVRPLIGVPMLLVAIGSVVCLLRFGKKNRELDHSNPYRDLGKGDDKVEVTL